MQKHPKPDWLTQEYLRKFLDYNPETGLWTWLLPPSNAIKAGSLAGTIKEDGYRRIGIGVYFYSSSLAWFYMTGEYPVFIVDHENGVRSDDRWVNLRPATCSENNANRRPQINNTSGYRGVSWDYISGKWDARVNGCRIGLFDDIEEAAIARDAAAPIMQGPFAHLNFPQ